MKFAKVFTDILRTQLVLKNIVSGEEFDAMKDFIHYDFATDNHFSELKEGEIMRERLELLSQAESYVGQYLSKDYVFRNILHLSDDEIEKMQSQMEDEGGDEDEMGDEF